ncbi:MAG: NAD(P)-binding domain-containing protein [Steroidobacteraceae bacterium]
MNEVSVAIVGAGPYGLSIAAHLAARGVEHRIFGPPMKFWSEIAAAGGERYLKSYCFGTNISSPARGFTFADYSSPRGLETFEPCSIADFANYGNWFYEKVVPWVEPHEAVQVRKRARRFEIVLANGELCTARHVVIASGLTHFARIPREFTRLSVNACAHTSRIERFSTFRGRRVAVVGAGQSALEAAALLYEAGAQPSLLIRDNKILWQTRVSHDASLWRKLRSPISGLGTGPKAWALARYPGALYHVPDYWRIPFVNTHLPPEGAWWLRSRVEGVVPTELNTTIVETTESPQGVVLRLRRQGEQCERTLTVDHVIAGTGYRVDVNGLDFLDASLRAGIDHLHGAPKLSPRFESSVAGLRFVGPIAAMSFGPLFRFVVGAEYTAKVIATDVALCKEAAE